MKPFDLPQDSEASRHFVAVVDRAHVRIFQATNGLGQSKPGLRLVEALDLVDGHGRFRDRLTDEAGHFPRGQPGAGGGNDERMPMQREGQRRLAAEAADWLSRFFQGRPQATWDVAVAKAIFHQVIDQIEAGARSRLRRVLAKDLTNQPAESLLEHFASAEPIGAAR